MKLYLQERRAIVKKAIMAIDYSFVLRDRDRFPQGMSQREFRAGLGFGNQKNRDLFLERVSGKAGFYSLPYFERETRKIIYFTRSLRKRFDTFVVLGIGGSALGTAAIMEALSDRLSKKRGRVLVLDNVDPDEFAAAISHLDLEKTVFNVISKSGVTPETLSQFFVVSRLLKRKVGKGWKEQIIITTDPEGGLLRDIARDGEFLSFPVPPIVGGRFSVFSPVGLLPLAFGGVDVNALLEGARFADGINLGTKGEANPVVVLAAIYSHFMEEARKNTFVLFSYSGYLGKLGEWFCQLWAESLGKERRFGGKTERVGQTPVGVVGVTAQHSQLQLYLDGPDDKIYTFIGPGRFKKDFSIRPPFKEARLEFFHETKMGDLFRAEMEATVCSLAVKGRPAVIIEPHERNAFSLGALMFLFECVTALTGKILRINPFDQPGVEYGKRLTKALLDDKMSRDYLDDVDEFKSVKGTCEINMEANWKGSKG
jgi:glucose-6-phosphate isomerase